jgi:hypothetical protein
MAGDIEGVIDSGKVYTLRALAKILGYKDTRSLRLQLVDRGIPVDIWGNHRITLISGRFLQQYVETSSMPFDEHYRMTLEKQQLRQAKVEARRAARRAAIEATRQGIPPKVIR